MNAIIDTLVPPDLSDGDLAKVLNDLKGLADNEIKNFGTNLSTNGGLQNDNIDTASIAQTAVLATIVATLEENPPYASTGEALVAAMNDSPENFGTYVTVPAGGLDSLTTDAGLTAIFNAAGLNELITKLSS